MIIDGYYNYVYLGKFHHDLTECDLTGNHGFYSEVISKWHYFRLVNYSNLPRIDISMNPYLQ